MLCSLSVRNLLLVRGLDIEFESGLNVLTGETGAGKSILLDALGFAFGMQNRIDSNASEFPGGEVAASFLLDRESRAKSLLESFGLPPNDELVVRRIISNSGRKSSFVNDRRCSSDSIRSLGEILIEFHGQRDDRGLMNKAVHRAMLDAFAGHGQLVRKTRDTWRNLQDARQSLLEAQRNEAAAKKDETYLRHALQEIEDLKPEPSEVLQLEERRRLMKAASKIGDDLKRAGHAIGSQGAEGIVGDAIRILERISPESGGKLDEAVSMLDRSLIEIGEASKIVEEFKNSVQFEPSDLEHLEDRLFALRALARKHGADVEHIHEISDELRSKLAKIENFGEDAAKLSDAAMRLEQEFVELAGRLSASRQASAERLDARIAGELAPLKLGKARFKTLLTATEGGPDGTDTVEFRVSTGPGVPLGQIGQIASGGELSRFLLALKVCLSSGDSGNCMVFDEIDSGIGGATADAVGRRLKALAKGAQVLVVTHSPQVAALGQHHWRVSKLEGVDQRISMSKLDKSERVEEIGRMLAGGSITEEARAAARALLRGD